MNEIVADFLGILLVLISKELFVVAMPTVFVRLEGPQTLLQGQP